MFAKTQAAASRLCRCLAARAEALYGGQLRCLRPKAVLPDHDNLAAASPAALLDDIERCNDAIERITGRRSKVYRFPGGSFTLSAALTDAVHGAGYTYVDWNASVRDAEIPGASPADLLNAAKSTSAGRNKVVLLCHDGAGKRATADALKDIIAFYRAGGYKFCTVK